MNMFDLFRAHRLRRTSVSGRGNASTFLQKLNLSVPTVFDNPPAMICRRPKVPAPRTGAGTCCYCCACAKLDWSTRTPGPIVLEIATFFR